MIRSTLLSAFILLSLSGLAMAGGMPHDRLSDPALETRAQHLFTELRCLVCQNQTIADSDARIAHDLRLLVRTRLQDGESDAAILEYIHSRYGDFVLMRPPVRAGTWGLWFGPVLILILGGASVIQIMRRARRDQQESDNT
jgi:cytochrome c-type biogenesis protein CcmH